MTTETTETLRPEEFFEFIALPERRADPYPFFARARSLAPAFPVGDIWLLSSYDFVSSILRDPRFSTDERKSSMNEQATIDEFHDSAFGRLYFNMLLFIDDPDHKRIRDLVQKAFTRKTVEDLRGRVGLLVDELVDGLDRTRRRRPHLRGRVPAADHRHLRTAGRAAGGPACVRRSGRRFRATVRDPAAPQPEDEQRGDVATTYFIDYFDRLIEEKRRTPGNDLLSSLVAVEDQGDVLTHDELLGTCLLILFAGHETTANLIGNGTLRAHAQPRSVGPARRRTRSRPLRRRRAAALRHAGADHHARVAMEDVAFGDQTIPAKTQIGIMLGAANRDPAHFPDPDRLDITRDQAALTAFGGGIHFCLGAPLARLEAQVMFNTLARRVPDLRVDGDVKWRPSFVIRGLEALPVTVG